MTNKLIVQNSEMVINQLKNEIAAEFGIVLGADTSSKMNGIVGGEITKRLIALGEQKLMEMSQETVPSNINNQVGNQSQIH